MTGRRGALQALLWCAAGCKSASIGADHTARIVSTSPSTTEMVFALSRGDSLVGRSSYCDHPPEAARVETIGGFADPNLERILALRPTIVCGERGPAGPEFVAALERHGLQTFFPPIDRVDDVGLALEELARKLAAEARGVEAVAALRATIEGVRARVRELAPPSVVMLFDWKPLVAAGPGSFPAEIVALAGGESSLKGGTKYPKLSTEGLLALDPDVIIDGSAGAYSERPADIVRTIPGLEALRAAQTARLHRLEGTAALRPGPRIGLGIEQVARFLHPAAFATAP